MSAGRDAIFVIEKLSIAGEDDLFQWLVKRGGRVLAKSHETYQRRRAAQRAIENLCEAIRQKKFRIEG